MLNFDETDAVSFYKYLEDIRNTLLAKAPEWHLEYRPMKSVDDPECAYNGYYSMSRWDWTRGKEQKWPIHIGTYIFAYDKSDDLQVPFKYFILNQHPIKLK